LEATITAPALVHYHVVVKLVTTIFYLGARRSESSSEIIYARQKVISVARAFNLQAIDMVYIKYQDLKGLKKQAEEGARWGFTGKQIIHPGQIDVTQEAFSPTSAEIEWASGVLKAFHKHQKEGEVRCCCWGGDF
jgi:citrate lyase subunit beta-like protein